VIGSGDRALEPKARDSGVGALVDTDRA